MEIVDILNLNSSIENKLTLLQDYYLNETNKIINNEQYDKITKILESDDMAIEKESYIISILYIPKDIKLSVEGFKWSGPGACGLTSSRIMLNYLDVNIEGDTDFEKEKELANIPYSNFYQESEENLNSYMYEFRSILDIEQILYNYKEIEVNDELSNGRSLNVEEVRENLNKAFNEEYFLPLLNINSNHFVVINGVNDDGLLTYLNPEDGLSHTKSIDEFNNLNSKVYYFNIINDIPSDTNLLSLIENNLVINVPAGI